MAAKLRGALGIAADPLRFESVRALTLFTSLDNKSSIAGTWLLQELLHRQLSTVAGDIAEAGIYTGGNACLTLTLAARHLGNRNYHLLDSFAGFPEFSSHDPQSRSGEFRDVSLGSIRDLFSHFECARLHVGFFAQTLPSLVDHTFALAYIDCDCYEPTLECCEFFYPRMSAGGMILFHDYWRPRPGLPPGSKEPFTGVAKAADEFAAAEGESIVVFPETTHALLFKGARN
jgi:O-methyltransferase